MNEVLEERTDEADVVDGNAVAARVRREVADAVETLGEAGVEPGLATVLMSDDPASETYVRMKQQDCEEVGIESHHVEIDPDAPAEELLATVEELNTNPEVNGVLVQLPLPDHVDKREVIRRIDPMKDVDAFHPENVGRLVAGNPRFVPCTPHGVERLLDAIGVDVAGKQVVVVGRSDIVGKPLANLLLQRGRDATVTVCHSQTEDLAAHVGRADIVVAAAGVPGLVTGDMLQEGAVVVDVGVNRVGTNEGESELVGDVDFESAKQVADAITPVPGGVGPMTRAMLLHNTVEAAARQHGVDSGL